MQCFEKYSIATNVIVIDCRDKMKVFKRNFVNDSHHKILFFTLNKVKCVINSQFSFVPNCVSFSVTEQ